MRAHSLSAAVCPQGAGRFFALPSPVHYTTLLTSAVRLRPPVFERGHGATRVAALSYPLDAT